MVEKICHFVWWFDTNNPEGGRCIVFSVIATHVNELHFITWIYIFINYFSCLNVSIYYNHILFIYLCIIIILNIFEAPIKHSPWV